MSVSFEPYKSRHRQACIGLFEANCPEYFLPNEFDDYAAFLDGVPGYYELCLDASGVVGAYGLAIDDASRGRVCWIMIDPAVQGHGIGTSIMERVVRVARERDLSVIEIAASHKSAPFFAKFRAQALSTTKDGWGPGMDRVDMLLEI